MSNNEQIITNVFGLLTDEFKAKDEVRELASALGLKPVSVNFSIKTLIERGVAEEIINENGEKMVRAINKTEKVPVVELKRAPKTERVRRTLIISEEDAEGLTLLNLRTPPVKKDIVYPDGVTKEMFNEFKQRILEQKDLLWDLIGNFNGAKSIAITMWEPENKEANEDGKVFYRWDEPEKSWGLMKQLVKVIELYETQESQKEEVTTEE